MTIELESFYSRRLGSFWWLKRVRGKKGRWGEGASFLLEQGFLPLPLLQRSPRCHT